MKTIQKIAAILYSVWAIYRCYILIVTILFCVGKVNIVGGGIKFAITWDITSILTISVLFLTPLSLLVLSAFLMYNAFSKKHSLKKQIVSTIWLGVNTALLVFLIPMSVLVSDAAIINTFLSTSQTLYLIISTLLSMYGLIAISLINIILLILKIWREKINENNSKNCGDII